MKDTTDNKRFGCDYHQYSLIKHEAPYEPGVITIKVQCMYGYIANYCYNYVDTYNLGFMVAIRTYCIINSAITKFGLCVDC